MPNDPWAEFNPQSAAPVAAPPAGPRSIAGTGPKPDKPKPYEPPSGYVGTPDGLKPIPGGPADKPNAPGTGKDTEGERKAAAFLIRALGSNSSYEKQKVGPRSLVGQSLAENVPSLLNSLPAFMGNSQERQISDTNQDEFIAASLRQDSGAAIPTDELEKQRRIYFPMPGDTEDTAKAKQMARLRAIEGLKQSAGGMADAAIQRWMAMAGSDGTTPADAPPDQRDTPPLVTGAPTGQPPAQGGGPNGGITNPEMRGGLPVGTDVTFGNQEPDWWDRDKALKAKFGVTPDQEQLITAFWNQNGATASPQAIKQWYSGQGLPVPTDDVIRQGIEHGQKGGAFGSFDLSAEKAAYENQIKVILDKQGFDPNSAGAYSDRVMQGGLMTLGDELSGVLGAADALVGNRGVADGYTQARDTARLALEQESQAQGFTGNALEFGGGLATGLKIPGGPIRSAATAGGLVGFGSGNGAEGSIGNALAMAALGGGVTKAGQVAAPYVARGANAVMNRLPGRNMTGLAPDAAEVMAAGGRQDIPIRRPDVQPSSRGNMGALEATERGGPIIRGAIADDAAAIEARVDRVGGAGMVQDPYALGSAAQSAGERYIARTGKQASALYRRADQLAGGKRISPVEADAAIETQIAELEAQGANTNATLIGYLKGLRQDIDKNGGFSVEEFQGLMSGAKAKIRGDQALTASDATRRLGGVVDAFERDAQRDLPGAAFGAVKNANAFYRERQNFVRGVLREFMGTKGAPLNAEAAGQRLVSMTKGSGKFDKFSAMWKELDKSERADIQATIAGSLGRNNKGDFSPALLVSALDPKKGLNPRTARLVFGDEGFAALQDLRAIAGAKTAAQTERNFSKTANAAGGKLGNFRTMLFGALGFGAGGPVTAVATGVAENFLTKLGEQRAARLLMDPKFTKALRLAPATANPKAINLWVARTTKAVGATPQAANDVGAFFSTMGEWATKSPGRAAADDEQN